MIFNVVDSTNARLCRGQHEQDGVELPHQLASQSRVEIPFAFAVADSTMLHQLRGVLTYMTQVSSLPNSNPPPGVNIRGDINWIFFFFFKCEGKKRICLGKVGFQTANSL